MKTSKIRMVLGFALGAQILLFQNCSNTRFTNETLETVDAKSCTDQLEYVTKPVKILFIVDNSTSNIDHSSDGKTVIGTDNGKVWRSSVINGVLDRYGKNSKISYSLASFQGDRTVPHIKSPDGQPSFTNDLNIVKDGFQEFFNTAEGPYTPYQSALFFTKHAIALDIAANPNEDAAYSVVMLSDGVPSGGSYNNRPDRVIPDAQAIMDVLPGKIRLNSVFYHNEVANLGDVVFLQNISNTGKGTFLVANTKEPFLINDLVQYAQQTCE